MAGNRPQYLFRMLKSLRGVQGLDPAMVTVFIDGFFEEPASVARMFGLRVDQHEGVSKTNSRICQVCISYGYNASVMSSEKNYYRQEKVKGKIVYPPCVPFSQSNPSRYF